MIRTVLGCIIMKHRIDEIYIWILVYLKWRHFFLTIICCVFYLIWEPVFVLSNNQTKTSPSGSTLFAEPGFETTP